uniref:Isoform A of Sodium/potassium/calcium exchanger Nckx30C n=1 Tax=Drosophila melanogaster TaxID=7227 RepID=Q9U6A0-2|nr:Nckx30C, isoform A [Drosophila melanogaster]NP_723483.1 Nckx30C, isoform B [Drosophila melanogaster]AAF52801.1 Nckx30C, isoform A [Drosophila melanogaster]AAN10706.1 Nckx30C, isoform B [Drosophila melanogaster]|eukprot:NP_723482.1 Nckx30C, isoform A [Drosophila melanogaster]
MLQPTTCSKQQQQRQQPAIATAAVGGAAVQELLRKAAAKDHGALAAATATATAASTTATTATAATASRNSSNTWCHSDDMLSAGRSRSSSTTIDFNSRRRRGRLRGHAPSDLAMNKQHQATILDECVNIFKRLVLLTLKTISATTITKAKTRSRTAAQLPATSAASATSSRGASAEQLLHPSSRSRCRSRRCLRLPIYSILLLCLTTQGLGLGDAAKPRPAKQHFGGSNSNSPNQNQNHNDVLGGVGAPSQTSGEDEAEIMYPFQSGEQMFGLEEDQEQDPELNSNAVPGSDEDNAGNQRGINDTHNDNSTTTKTPLFPKDLFTKEQLENGAVILHIIGVIYMFVALAIVCDEFFVPSLDVIIEKLGITDDVAGATFMAAGGSAPELFTSVIGVFVSFDDVGIGTIVGSAVFNILFVIGMCALFSKTVLSLTWWPLFRDCSFYSISLLVLIYFFRDNRIFWWEALILFTIYIGYVAFMKWNVQVETCVKKMITKNKVTRVRSTDQLMPAGNAANSSETSMATQPGGSVTSRAASETRSGPPGSSNAGATGNSSGGGGTSGSTQTGAKFRHGLLQLMIHTIDPLHDGKVDEKATQLHAIASLKVLLDATKPQRGGATTSAANHVKINLKETTLADRPNGNIDTTLDSAPEIEDEPEPLSMAWPDTARKRLTYVLVAPLLVPMWLTLPDTRTPRGKRFFPVTFIGSIVWIAAFSYLMVWWANVAGDTARIPPEVMGLTFLAAGTSIPDLITSVIVARKGFGDMAVSSSVGSNIFDVTVGLPIPWLLYGIIYGAPVEVNSVGMVCSITILFMMLVFVVMSIACFRWRMNKGLGFTMFLLYFAFVAVSLMFEYDVITCPF